MSKKKLIEGDGLFNFVQLESGKWAGQGLSGVYVSEVFPLGQTPDRFKYTTFYPANKSERAEYWKKCPPVEDYSIPFEEREGL
jgi:hypothetical protein